MTLGAEPLAAEPLAAQPPAAQPPAGTPLPASDAARVEELVTANQILYDQGVLDGFGHVSVRSAADPRHYFLARGGLVPERVRVEDVIECDEDSESLDEDHRAGPGERFIHGAIYRARPDVYAVVHSHTQSVIPYTITGVPLRAVIHTAHFLGSEPAPVFEMRDWIGEDNRMLVDTPVAGDGLARVLGQRAVVLMRGHGLTTVGPSLHDVVYRAIYTRVNAEVESAALALGQPVHLNEFEVDRDEPVSMQWSWWAAQAARRHRLA